MYKCTNKNNSLNWIVNEDQKNAMQNGPFKRSFVFTPLKEVKTVATPPEAKAPKKAKSEKDKKSK
jgi:hypothetical protein